MACMALLGVMIWPCVAASAATETYSYTVTHAKYGPMGTYDRTVNSAGAVTTAQSRLRTIVKILGIVVHREDADQTEIWRGGQLVSFHSVTTVNGSPLIVHGEVHGDHFVITTPSGTAVAPLDIAPSDPWSFKVGRGTVVSIKSGKIDPVNVTGGEAERVVVRGVSIPVRHYHVNTATQPDKWAVWLDAKGLPIKFQSLEHGADVDFVMTSHVG